MILVVGETRDNDLNPASIEAVVAAHQMDDAVSAVGAIPDSPAKQSLIGLAHDAIQRSF